MSNEAPLTTSNKISDEQWKVVYVLAICSASLSLLGSSAIVFKILRDGARKITPYDRIILGLSSCDIISSIVFAIDQFLWPVGNMGTSAWTFGNQTTCKALGFLKQFFTLWTVWYNGMLSFYFLLTVISQMRRRDYVRKWEPLMHLSGAFFPITAITGLRHGWYAKNNVCWITDPKIKWIVAGVPVFFTYAALIINYSAIYAIVRKSLKTSEHIAGPTLVQKRLKREATTLMFLYIASFFVTISPTVVIQVLSTYFGYTGDNDSKIYAVWVLHSIFFPLQGFFNFFIYLKPAYTRFRASNPNKPMYFVLHQALFNPNVPEMHYPSDHSATTVVADENLGISSTLFESHLNCKGHAEENENDTNTNEDLTIQDPKSGA